MKILTVNCVYEIYSTGKIIKNIAEFLADRDCEFFIAMSLVKRQALPMHFEYRGGMSIIFIIYGPA